MSRRYKPLPEGFIPEAAVLVCCTGTGMHSARAIHHVWEGPGETVAWPTGTKRGNPVTGWAGQTGDNTFRFQCRGHRHCPEHPPCRQDWQVHETDLHGILGRLRGLGITPLTLDISYAAHS